jgi:DNA-binding PadR family transcriptional regulator
VPGDELSLFSYEVLGLVGRGGAGPHDLKRMVERGRLLAWAGESQYYTEPKRLARLGYLEAQRQPGRTRERTVYMLTDKGVEALREFARHPLRVTPVKSEVLIRLLVADLAGEAATAESMRTLRADVADLAARVDEAEAVARQLPQRERNLQLVYGFLRRFLDLHLELADAVERELGK